MVFELSPTNHAAIVRVAFPAGSSGSVYIRTAVGSEIAVEGKALKGFSSNSSRGKGLKLYFVVEPDSVPMISEKPDCKVCPAKLDFSGGEVVLRIATSLISAEQAELNLNQELARKSFDDVVGEGKQVWADAFDRVKVEMQDDAQQKVFYTNLWKSMLFPRFLTEINKTGQEVHYSPFHGNVASGKLVADSGFWDAYHTVYPLNSVLFPDNLGNMMEGWLNAYSENRKRVPQWPSPGNGFSMVSTMSDVSIADAIVKSEAGNFPIDREKAYKAIRTNAFQPPHYESEGRQGLSEYDASGFLAEMTSPPDSKKSQLLRGRSEEAWAQALEEVMQKPSAERVSQPSEEVSLDFDPDQPGATQRIGSVTRHSTSAAAQAEGERGKQRKEDIGQGAASTPHKFFESVSKVLNSIVSDAAIANAAEALGKEEDASRLRNRTRRAATMMFNRETKFFQPKTRNGTFQSHFNPLVWRNGFTEGSAYHYRYYLPHDVEYLKELYDGELCKTMQADLESTSGPAYYKGGYPKVSHEMTEHASIQGDFGMYNHCNQPSHEVLWIAKKAGCDRIADKYIRRAMDKLYSTSGWCGDEDNGEMASWYVLSALGIYSLEGGKDELVVGSPAVVPVRPRSLARSA